MIPRVQEIYQKGIIQTEMSETTKDGSVNIGMVEWVSNETDDGTSFSDNTALSKRKQSSQLHGMHEDAQTNSNDPSKENLLVMKTNSTGGIYNNGLDI